MKQYLLLIFISSLVILTGCETTQPLYYHGDYNQVLYSHFKGEGQSLSEQISKLNTLIDRAKAKSKPVAPGVYAHLGYLHMQAGNKNEGLQNFELEKAYFPESEGYINFLMANMRGNKNE
jgi:hypothetical protein